MKITAPIVSAREIAPAIKAGADELYFGLDLNRDTNDANALNLYPTPLASFRSIVSVKQAIEIIHGYGKTAFLCFNNEFYLKEQYGLIAGILRKLKGLDGVVLTDVPLISMIRRQFPRLKIAVSTRTNIFNSSALEYFAGLGVKRFVLPRDLYGKDLLDIIKNYRRYEFEIFMKNENCPYVNGLCTHTHNIWNEPGKAQLFCRDKRWDRKDALFFPGNSAIKERVGLALQERLKTLNCGACSLIYLRGHNRDNIYLKLTGRMRSDQSSWKDVEFIKTALGLLQGSGSEADFSGEIQKLYKKIYLKDCDGGCWYAFRKH